MKIAQETLLNTERLCLRKIQKRDLEDIIEIYSSKEIFQYTNSDMDLSSEFFHIEKDCALSMIESWETDGDLMCWGIVLKHESKLIGRIYLYGITGNEYAGYRVDVGYSISVAYSGHGYATEAVKRLTDYGFAELKVTRFQAEILPKNVASIKVCEKSGFQNEGLLHKYSFYKNNGNCFRDVVMMALTRS